MASDENRMVALLRRLRSITWRKHWQTSLKAVDRRFRIGRDLVQRLNTLNAKATYPVTDPYEWYLAFLTPLYADGYFLPPLFALNLYGAAITRARHSSRRNATVSGEERFFNAVREAVPDRRKEKALRLATLVAARLMGQREFDASHLRGSTGFSPKDLVISESLGLDSAAGMSGRLQVAWKVLRELMESHELDGIVGASRVCGLHAGHEHDIDPFVPRLLIAAVDRKPDVALPNIIGSWPRSENPRPEDWCAGEFSQRRPGPLPERLSRLAPLELLQFVDLDLRDLFLYRATTEGLNQNYYHTQTHARREPIVLIQIDLCDQADDHKLLDPPAVPVVCWYRALLIELMSQLHALHGTENWLKRFVVTHRDQRYELDLEATHRVSGDASRIDTRMMFELLARSCPAVVAASSSASQRRLVRQPASDTRRVDLWLRYSIGETESATEAENPQQVRSQRGCRVVRRRDGSWSVEFSSCNSELSRLKLSAEWKPSQSPNQVASRIIRQTFASDESQTHDRSNHCEVQFGL